MAWKCPECGILDEGTTKECSCGYSFFKTLGVKPGASPEEVKNAYEYSRGIWVKDSSSSDPALKKKAGDRLKKIDAAYETYRQYSSRVDEEEKASPRRAVLAAIAAGVLVIVISAIFYLSSKDRTARDQGSAPDSGRPPATSPSNSPVPQAGAPQSPAEGTPRGGSDEQLPLIITEETAIELVRKSDALLKNTSVEMIVKKWTEDNSANYKIVGWQAKKFDDDKILVSYTAMDGDTPKGFYFDVNVRSGAVQDIRRSPELQKKYNIQYSR